MRILLVGESSLFLAVQKQILSRVFPEAEILQESTVSGVKRQCLTNRFDLVVSDFEMPDVHRKEWPGCLYAWFPESRIAVLYSDAQQVEGLHQVLADRCTFMGKMVSPAKLRTELIAMTQNIEAGAL